MLYLNHPISWEVSDATRPSSASGERSPQMKGNAQKPKQFVFVLPFVVLVRHLGNLPIIHLYWGSRRRRDVLLYKRGRRKCSSRWVLPVVEATLPRSSPSQLQSGQSPKVSRRGSVNLRSSSRSTRGAGRTRRPTTARWTPWPAARAPRPAPPAPGE